MNTKKSVLTFYSTFGDTSFFSAHPFPQPFIPVKTLIHSKMMRMLRALHFSPIFLLILSSRVILKKIWGISQYTLGVLLILAHTCAGAHSTQMDKNDNNSFSFFFCLRIIFIAQSQNSIPQTPTFVYVKMGDFRLKMELFVNFPPTPLTNHFLFPIHKSRQKNIIDLGPQEKCAHILKIKANLRRPAFPIFMLKNFKIQEYFLKYLYVTFFGF